MSCALLESWIPKRAFTMQSFFISLGIHVLRCHKGRPLTLSKEVTSSCLLDTSSLRTNIRLVLRTESFPYWFEVTSVDAIIWGSLLIDGSQLRLDDTGRQLVKLVIGLLNPNWRILYGVLLCVHVLLLLLAR